MDPHPIQWTAPSPLWPELAKPGNGSGRAEFGAPAILRFATDDFMQDFVNTLATDPRKLGEFRAGRETWRGKVGQPTIPTPKKLFALQMQRLGSRGRRTVETGGKVPALSDAQKLPRLKLYQPAHQRYYLITACLTCRTAGLPDRKVDTGKQERVGFVLRRLFQPTQPVPGKVPADAAFWDEYGWVKTPAGYAWQKVRNEKQTTEDIVLEGEERLPLFPATLQEDDQRGRRLFAGLIPVGKREAYLGAQKVAAGSNNRPSGVTPVTARKILLRKQVIEPWKALVRQMETAGTSNQIKVKENGDRVFIPGDKSGIKSTREQAQVISWLLLLDCAKFLEQYLPLVFGVINGASENSLAPHPHQRTAFNALKATKVGSDLGSQLPKDSKITAVATSLVDALKRILPFEQKLERSATSYQRDVASNDWPDFLFPLADADLPGHAPVPPVGALGNLSPEETTDSTLTEPAPVPRPVPNPEPYDVVLTLQQIDKLAVLLVRAMGEYDPNGPLEQPDIPAAAIPPEDPTNAVFRIRCVYERPACGPLHEDVVSDPTEPFDLAGFFDPDAPARPIRIGLPIDTTPAGLRKFDKNTAFVMSDILCGQVQKMKSLGFIDLVLSVLPWPFHKDLSVGDMKPCGSPSANFGMICSLSIPIITICALILLMIIVSLLDIIFRWMPYFIICFPLPGFKGKK